MIEQIGDQLFHRDTSRRVWPKKGRFAHIADKLAAQEANAAKLVKTHEPRQLDPMIDRVSPSCYRRDDLGRLRRLPRLGVLAAGSLLAVASSGCGPVEYISQVGNRAASSVSAAKLAQADRYAPYEYTAAEEYLHKAREEAGHAQYQDAIEYGRRSEELANRARALSTAKLAQQPSKSTMSTPAREQDEPAPLPKGSGPE